MLKVLRRSRKVNVVVFQVRTTVDPVELPHLVSVGPVSVFPEASGRYDGFCVFVLDIIVQRHDYLGSVKHLSLASLYYFV